MGRATVPLVSIRLGTYCAGGLGSGSLPIEYLIAISQELTDDKKSSFWGSSRRA
jgi:hypothetical protein